MVWMHFLPFFDGMSNAAGTGSGDMMLMSEFVRLDAGLVTISCSILKTQDKIDFDIYMKNARTCTRKEFE